MCMDILLTTGKILKIKNILSRLIEFENNELKTYSAKMPKLR